ncbi:MAG: N-acetylmuramoyl-L-alanine amidase [Butyribacter sp.]|nr:N-acetylmuramoyl-L-alanine amidase [bacterium]MDY3853447.1 N-acetylmuramoyl-L-alanine amidase [Butyribacter sp.]
MATVMIDAGHGGYDNGAVFEGRAEKNDTLNLALAVGNILENSGVDVLYTRTTDIYQSPNEKANIANRSDASYFISLHRNSSENPDTYSGVQTLVYEDAGIPALFAQNINAALEKTGFANLGTSVRPNLAVLRGTNMPAALVEVGFINTEQDNQLFDLKFPEIAQAIADGILQTIQGANLEATEMENYSVETGTFMHYRNAELLAKNMQEDSIDSFIEPVNRCYRVCHGKFTDKKKAQKAAQKLFERGYEARVIVR